MNTQVMTEKFEDMRKRATDTAKDFGHATDRYVHDNTWMTIAIAAAVGCVLGFLLTRRGD